MLVKLEYKNLISNFASQKNKKRELDCYFYDKVVEEDDTVDIL